MEPESDVNSLPSELEKGSPSRDADALKSFYFFTGPSRKDFIIQNGKGRG